jgi:alpha-L-fucosidase 2
MYYFTTMVAGSTMDMQILKDLFSYYIEATRLLGLDGDYAAAVAAARMRLVPPQVGEDGSLQEWTEDYGQLEDKHRHFSHLYGLFPGNVLSATSTPEFVEPVKAVLEQRGDGGTGFSRAWKMALWARLSDGDRAHSIYKGYLAEQCYPSLFAKCFTPLQVDGALGVTAGISEMLVQSHEGMIELLPALPAAWASGEFRGVCARGGFELDMKWEEGAVKTLDILSKAGTKCKIRADGPVNVFSDGNPVGITVGDGVVEFPTEAGGRYRLEYPKGMKNEEHLNEE